MRQLIVKRFLVAQFVIFLGLGLAVSSSADAATKKKAPAPAVEATQDAPDALNIKTIKIAGVQKFTDEAVLSFSGLKPGKLTYDQIDEAIRKIDDTGFFRDVSSDISGDVLTLKVEENPTIAKIAYEGNKELSDDDLKMDVGIRARDIFSAKKADEAADRIMAAYRTEGNFNAHVEPKIIPLDQNKVNLVFEISEGSFVGVQRIHFIGNHAFNESQLRSTIMTRETAWYSFLTGHDQYDPAQIDADKEALHRYYFERGYIDFKIKSAVSQMSQNRKGFYVTYTLDEGKRYTYSNVSIKSDIARVNTTSLMTALLTAKGDFYNLDKIEKSTQKINDELGQLGYAFVDVSPETQNKNVKNNTVDLVYHIKEGQKVTVEKINVIGNVRTIDKVIRREMKLVEGDPYNAEKLRQSRRNIQNLGFFSKVDLKTRPGTTRDKIIIDVHVDEQSTGQVSFGAGFSTVDNFIGDVSLEETNLFGTGNKASVSTNFSSRKQEFDLSLTNPYFMDRNVTAGVDLYSISRDNQRESSYDLTKNGVGLRMGYNINEDLSQNWSYNYRVSDISNVKPTASRFVKDQEGTTTVSSISQSLVYDKTDNRIDPTDGYMMRWSIDLAGLGGDSKFIRNRVKANNYISLAEHWIIETYGDAGYIKGLGGHDVGIAERFFMGGDSFPGFELSGIGPRDITTGDALGGNAMYKVGTELHFPVGLDEDGVSGRLFTEAGSLWGIDESGPEIRDTSAVRATGGIGVVWASSFGPIRVDFSKPYLKQDYDKEQIFRFSIGTRF